MPTAKRKINLFDSEEGTIIKEALLKMVSDTTFSTGSSYSANITAHPDHLIPFVEKHMTYLNNHPSIDPVHYLANLRLITRIR